MNAPSVVTQNPFDLVSCTQRCIERVIEEKGLKILLLDDEVKSMISMSFSFTAMLKKDLYLVDQVHNAERKKQGHLKALVYIRPTEANITALCAELRSPLYAEYIVFFSNVVTEEHLSRLADADNHEVVKQVHEVFADYFPLHPFAFSVDIEKPLIRSLVGDDLSRVTDSILSVLLSVRRGPSVRYQGNSPGCKMLASGLVAKMGEDSSLFSFRRSDDCSLLIVDRMDDLVTPLLTQWTYEAMIHEEYGLYKHKSVVEKEEMNLIPLFDSFLQANLHSNWGDLCTNVKAVVDSYRDKTDYKSDGGAENLENLKAFMDKMPELRKESIVMGKHTTIAAGLSKKVKERSLLDVSLLEQDMVCSNQSKDHTERLLEIIENDAVWTVDVVRLVLLYILRWERNAADIQRVTDALNAKRTLNSKQDTALAKVLAYGGAGARASDLFDDSKLTSIIKRAVKGMQDVENVYTQHEPVLKKTITAVLNGKLSQELWPYASSLSSPVCVYFY